MKSTILVTGSNGQLGSEIKDLSKKNSFNFIFKDLPELDITDTLQLHDFFSKTKIDYCINCAAYTAVDKAEEDIETAYKINTEGVKNLAEVCAKYNTLLIHISTDFVFDGNISLPYKETDEAIPLNIYGKSKLEGEIFSLKYNPRTIVIRTSWLYSSYGSNFVKTILRLAEQQQILKIVSDQIGTPTYAADLAHVILEVIRLEKNIYGIYHYSNEGVASWYDFANSILEIKNIKKTIIPVESSEFQSKTPRPAFSVLNKAKLKNDFQIKIPYWRDSLKECLSKLA